MAKKKNNQSQQLTLEDELYLETFLEKDETVIMCGACWIEYGNPWEREKKEKKESGTHDSD